MTKKLLAISLALMLLVPMAFAKIEADKIVTTGNSVQVLMPGSGQQVPANVLKSMLSKVEGDGEFTRVKTQNNVATPAGESTRDDLLWTLKHVDDNADYYLSSGAAEDTFAVVFTPAAPAVVTEVYQMWYTAGNVNAFGADYSAAAAAISPDGRSDAIGAGVFDGTPIGEIRTTITPNTIDEYTADWSYQLDIGGTFVVGDSTDLSNVPPFVIAWVKGGEMPQPLSDATADRGLVSYTWFGGPWTVNDAGVVEWRRYSNQIDLSMLVKVTYPWGAPIAVNTLSQHNNTYDTDGPFTILADLFDDVSDGVAIGGTDNIVFHWTVGGVETTGSLTADEIGADGNGWYAYDISGSFEPGDVIEYWITAVDNDGLASESVHLDFMVTEPGNPDADLLIVYDGSDEDQLAYTLYENVADDLGIVYEYWNVTDQKGIDASVVNAGWSNIVVYGWGTTVVPAIAGEAVNGFDTFLDNGGSLILADQDWYFGHGLPAEITFAAGDFAYDYFGIGSGTNDPADDDNICTSDTTFYGIGGTAMDLDFAANPMVVNHTIYGTLNWADPVVPASAVTLFAGATDGLSYGVAYESGTFKTAYFGFMPDAAVDTLADGTLTSDQFDAFFEGALSWMGVSSPAAISDVAGPTGTVLAGPYDVSATIEDFDGDAITANILFSADGAEWTSFAMTADGSSFTGQIPDVSEAGIYYWGIEATSDGAVSMYPPANEAAMMFERFAPEFPSLVVFNGLATSGYPADYYFAYTDMEYDVWGKELSAELASAYTTIIEIATDGPVYDNSAVITAWLTEGEKNYMLAGDEWFGALSNWTDMDFAAGTFEYDVLGVSHSYNDINASSSLPTAIEAVDGSVVSGALYTAHMAAGDTLMYDPAYEIEVSNWLDGFVPVDAASVNMTTFGDNPVAIGLNRVVNDDKVVFFGFDPMSINATPYTWWSFTAQAPQNGAIDFFGIVSTDDRASLPTEFSLAQNYPNPFNPSTTISFEVPTSSDVVISVYNMLGQKVVDLVNNSYAPGVYNVQWNGVNADGKPVGSGLYIYQMNAGKYSATSKMLYLK